MLTLIQHAQVYSPAALGHVDVLITGAAIAEVGKPQLQGDAVAVLDARGCLLIPGLVDSLAHITGGGGEGGFRTRTPELDASDAFAAGVTTLVGVLGTDSITRSLPN